MSDSIRRLLGEGVEDSIRKFYTFLVRLRLDGDGDEDTDNNGIIHDLVQYAAGKMPLSDAVRGDKRLVNKFTASIYRELLKNTRLLYCSEESYDDARLNRVVRKAEDGLKRGVVFMEWGEMGYYEIIMIHPSFVEFAKQGGYEVITFDELSQKSIFNIF